MTSNESKDLHNNPIQERRLELFRTAIRFFKDHYYTKKKQSLIIPDTAPKDIYSYYSKDLRDPLKKHLSSKSKLDKYKIIAATELAFLATAPVKAIYEQPVNSKDLSILNAHLAFQVAQTMFYKWAFQEREKFQEIYLKNEHYRLFIAKHKTYLHKLDTSKNVANLVTPLSHNWYLLQWVISKEMDIPVLQDYKHDSGLISDWVDFI